MDAETWSDRFASPCLMTIVLLSYTRSLVFGLVKGPNALETLLHDERRIGMKTVWKTDEEDFCEAMHPLPASPQVVYNTAINNNYLSTQK